jgi:hypothetical protein
MSWRIITESDLLKQISGVELEALRGVVLADGQIDPVQPAIDDVTAEVRGYVAGNVKNDLDADASKIPDRLIGAAVAKIIIQIMTRAGGTMIDPEGARAKAADKADTLLGKVARGEFSIADPVSGNEGSSSIRPGYHSTRCRQKFSRESQEGL